MKQIVEGRRVIDAEIAGLRALRDRLDAHFSAAVKLILDCEGKVVVCGVGKSGWVGRKMASTLSSTGSPAFFLHGSEGVHGELGVLMRGDLGILISNGGATRELISIAESMRRLNVPLIVLTRHRNSPLGRVAGVTLEIGDAPEACPFGLAPTTSSTVTVALGDALALAVLKMRGLCEQDVARLHPAGSIGRRLALLVGDLMASGDQNPVVDCGATMGEAIITMSSMGLGGVSVIDSQRRLLGVLTDGDLRRALQRFPDNLLDVAVIDVMTPTPVVARPELLAFEAMRLMEDRPSQISVLPVIDGDVCVGWLRLHDLVKAGIA